MSGVGRQAHSMCSPGAMCRRAGGSMLLLVPVPDLSLLDRVGLRQRAVAPAEMRQPPVVAVQHPDLLLGEILHVDEPIARAVERRHDLV